MRNDDQLRGTVRTALARSVTDREVSDDVVNAVAEKVVTLSSAAPIRRFDICAYGICIDYFVEPSEWHDLVKGVFDLGHPIRRFTGFPWGIFEDDLMQISFEVEVDELAGLMGTGMGDLGGAHH